MNASTDILMLTVAFFVGIGLGAFYLLVLWVTTRKLVRSSAPAAWLLGGVVLRMGVLLGGFWLISDGHWTRLVAALAGFVVARTLAIHRVRRMGDVKGREPQP
jgi:F1F0 ATPase subunit 2